MRSMRIGRLLQSRRVAVCFLTVLAVVAGGAASAYWTAPGAGAGVAGTDDSSLPVTLSPAVPSTALHPGGAAEVALTVTNPNSSVVRISSLALDTTQGSGGFAVDEGHAACPASTFSYATPSSAGAGWTVPAKSGSTDGTAAITLGGALSMSVDASDSCQGAVVTVYLRAA